MPNIIYSGTLVKGNLKRLVHTLSLGEDYSTRKSLACTWKARISAMKKMTFIKISEVRYFLIL